MIAISTLSSDQGCHFSRQRRQLNFLRPSVIVPETIEHDMPSDGELLPGRSLANGLRPSA
jgi:hypothetical protein